MSLQIIIPVHNEESFLPRTLRALHGQARKADRVIVVDDSSTDRSVHEASKFPVEVHTFRQERGRDVWTVGRVISYGSRFITEQAQYIGILDADVLLPENYYQSLIAHMEKAGLGLASGRLRAHPRTPPFRETALTLGLIPHAYGGCRLYTAECWKSIHDGLRMRATPVWDVVASILAVQKGFRVGQVRDVVAYALRPEAPDRGFNRGYEGYVLGSYPWYLLLTSLRHRDPEMLSGYISASMRKEKVLHTLRPFVRRTQIARTKQVASRILSARSDARNPSEAV